MDGNRGEETLMATTLGFSEAKGLAAESFHARLFLYIIKSVSGRFLPLLQNGADFAEMLLAQGIAGDLVLLGYQRL